PTVKQRPRHMNWIRTERIVAALVFVYALILYVLTVAPTASFWDAGEFIAIANRLEVSHPPGAPFYMLVGRLFSMFVPVEYVSLSVNLISVLASAFTILLTHLIIVRLVREWQGDRYRDGDLDRATGLIGGVIGASTFAVTDSFWFNAVEAEVYALSMLFTAIVVWLILKWGEQARSEEASLTGGHHPFSLSANRYLVLIAYLFGLAIGVHLLNLLAIFFIALIIFYTEFEREEWTRGQYMSKLVITGLVSSVAFLLVYPGITLWLPTAAGAVGSPALLLLAVVGGIVYLIHWTQRRGMSAANLIALSVAVVLIGYSTYALIFIRSAADPPIDENDPENAAAIVSYLKREQYGATPIFKGTTFDDRSGQPGDREVFFPRRWSPDQNHIREYRRYDSDLGFFLDYQVGHMYLRYFAFNFVGRASDVQDAPYITGIPFFDEGKTDQYFQTPSERASRNAYFAFPLLLGLLGLAHHFVRDPRRAFAVMILFLVTGIGIIVYLNQPPLQPRERDYAYVASFFAFSLWIGIGATAIVEFLRESLEKRNASPRWTRLLVLQAAAITFIAVPGWMLITNFDDHDRSGRYVAPDYAYNMLMSTAENAIIFTNGDNDTFPLWYLQEVEGVRRDVRVANLSLMNTPWYIRQLKDQWSRESAPLPISLSNEQIRDIAPRAWRPSEVTLPVNKEKLFGASEMISSLTDTSMIQSPMKWTLEGRPLSQDLNFLHAADQAALDIIVTNARQDWERPVYFAVTVSPDGQLNLENYFQLEGQAHRVVPIRHEQGFLGRVATGITPDRLRQFRFRNLDDPDVYFDQNIRNMLDNYRSVFAHTAQSLAVEGRAGEAQELLDDLMEKMPFETIPGDVNTFVMLANAYHDVGDHEQAVEIATRAEPLVMRRLQSATTQRQLELAARYVQLIRLVYMEAGDFQAASELGGRIADFFGDSTFRQSAEELRLLYERSFPTGQAAGS
ncbi:MAG: DUF2723 domain-containing protein, partial [Rhodothermales bacterium]|nr:DUF2723 domain-containing protein [Rhodothermales bacterium]